MKSKVFSLITCLIMCISLSVHAQTYDKLWKKVETMASKDRPKSALELTQTIYAKALKEQNAPEAMKAYLYGMDYQDEITPDSLFSEIQGLERWAKSATDPMDAAMLHSILGGLYANCLVNHTYTDNSVNVMEEEPENMSEWNLCTFIQKEFEHLRLSLVSPGLLLKTSADAFRPIVEKGDAGKYFHHDLLHLLGHRAIEILSETKWKIKSCFKQTGNMDTMAPWNTPEFLKAAIPSASDYDSANEILRIYQLMLNAYQQKGDRQAFLLTDLDRLSYMYNQSSVRLNSSAKKWKNDYSSLPYYLALKALADNYSDSEVCTEVYIKMANFALSVNDKVKAVRLVREGVEKYPGYDRINALKDIERSILQPALRGQFAQVVYPNALFDIKVSYSNLKDFTLKIYRLNLPADSYLTDNFKDKKFRSQHAKLIDTQHFLLKESVDYQSIDTTFRIKSPGAGAYLVELISGTKGDVSDYNQLYVTGLQVINHRLPDNNIEFVVVDAMSGHPVEGAEIIVAKDTAPNQYEQLQSLISDKSGTAVCLYNKEFAVVRAVKGKDNGMPWNYLGYNGYRFSDNNSSSDNIKLFTDRGIYRPGQIVYVSGIAYERIKDQTNVLADKEYSLQLFDVNAKMIAEKTVKTNEFGSFAGEFTLPSPCLTGRFALKVNNAWASIQVEEYKRPTFDITFSPVTEAYTMGDSIWVAGEARTYSGVPVQNAVVKYSVERRNPLFWKPGYNNIYSYASGEVKTDDEGKFRMKIYLKPAEDVKGLSYWYYTYQVNASVTAEAGETQSGQIDLPVGSSSLVLFSNLPSEMQKESRDSITFSVKNLSQEPVRMKGEYEVYRLDENTGKDQMDEAKGKLVLKSVFDANQAFEPASIRDLPSGAYRLVLLAKDSEGRETKLTENFILFSADDKKPPVNEMVWFYKYDKTFSEEHPATLLFGTSGKDIYVLYDVFSGEKRVESRRFILTDSIVKLVFPYKQEYGDGIFVQLAFVKDGTFYEKNTRIIKTVPDKKLSLKWNTFRDKLRPGQKEEWKLTILSPDGKPADAELLATMYDASLDKLFEHDWSFYLNIPRAVPYTGWNVSYKRSSWIYLNFPFTNLKYKMLTYDRLIPNAGITYDLEKTVVTAMGIQRTGKSRGVFAKEESSPVFMSVRNDADMKVEGEDGLNVRNEEVDPSVQLRENFAETAFFYPQLRTNGQGEVAISFILPESLTEWKFMGFSHTKEMDYGLLTSSAVASKEFMISPNIPRFVRVGDKASIAASIMNLSSQNINGTVKMELFNPETEKVFFTQKQKFAVKAGQTQVADFTFNVDEKNQIIACRIIADGGKFSDGEQQFIPVLTNKEWITESVPLNVIGEETKEFSLVDLFNKNSKTATERRLTVEFTGNPAWYAVQALPSLSKPLNDNAVSWISAYYANNLASSIILAHPKIKSVFDSWKMQGGNKETLWSNLQKNQDLKNILLEESPWLAEATNEAEQKQRIAVLFDLNNLENSNSVAAGKLKELQLTDGSWTWYKGMNGSRYVTQFVVESLGRLQILTGKKLANDMQTMYNNAFNYLNKQALEEYKYMKKAEGNGVKDLNLSDLTVHYLYLCALTDAKLPEANVKANSYFIDKLPQMIQNLTIYGKAVSAVILNKAGKEKAAQDYMISLQQYAVESKDMGMYYDTKKARYSLFSYKIPTQVAVIEAMDLVSKNMKAVEQLKIWLLNQKQTQSWDSPLATVNAVYALLDRGVDLLNSKGDVRITLGNKVIETFSPAKTAVPGLGYVKETFTDNQIQPDMKTVIVEKRDAGIAWGAVYAQYLEDMDNVSKQGNSLTVDKKLFIERKVGGISQLTPLGNTKNLKVGDKVIVRLILKTDRDMDFVQLKDQRPACFEPASAISGYRWQNPLGYYLALKDASSEYFFDSLKKGTYVLESVYYVDRTGEYSSGIATLQSAYAPEFTAHTGSVKIKVD